jgi:ribosomal protein S18 acetylase RimI-like enzyme
MSFVDPDPLPTSAKSPTVAFCGRGPMKGREATLADKAAIIELWERCALTRPWNDASRDFDFAHSGPASAVIVLESDSVIIGAALVGHDGHRGSTYYVGVDPKVQRNGAGRALMAAVEDWLRAREVWKLNLLVRRENDGVVRFYEKLGYGDQDCVALGKRLDGQADRSTGN